MAAQGVFGDFYRNFICPGGDKLDLADSLNIPYQRVNEIINERRGITPKTALRLAKFFNISADYWMNLQLRWDLYYAQQDEEDQLKKIHPFKVPAGSA